MRCSQLEVQEADLRRTVFDRGRVHGPLPVAKESIWMVDFLKDLGVSIHDKMVVNADNQESIALAKNPVFHDRSKHIDIQYHYT